MLALVQGIRYEHDGQEDARAHHENDDHDERRPGESIEQGEVVSGRWEFGWLAGRFAVGAGACRRGLENVIL